MIKFTDIFIRRPVLSISISLLIFLLGANSLSKMPLQQYPQLTNTLITISTSYVGASAELMQGFVAQPLQQALAEVNNIDYMISESSHGSNTITIQMKLGSDPDVAMTEALNKVNAVRGKLPSEVQDPIISVKLGLGDSPTILHIGFYSDTLSASQVVDYLERIVKPQLLTVAGVSKVRAVGGTEFAMRIWLDPHQMAARGLSASDVLTALRKNNYQSSPGRLESEWFLYDTEVDTSLNSVADFEQLVVASRPEGIIQLRDVADIELGSARVERLATVNSRRAVVLDVDITPKANPLVVAKEVKKILPLIESNLPDQLQMKLVLDRTVSIQESIDQVMETMIEATAIVIAVIFLFLGSLRAVIIPIICIPVSLVGVALGMEAMGFSLNLITLLAMVLAIGLVVDDAIVVVENIDRHIKLGTPRFQAAIRGAREIAVPVLTITLTLVAVFAPVAFLEGVTGSLFREFALTLAGSVMVSGVAALTLSPMMSAFLLGEPGTERSIERCVQRVFTVIDRNYAKLLDGALLYRPVFLVFALIVMVSLPFLFRLARSELAPAEDPGIVAAIATAPQNANLDYIDRNLPQVVDILAKQPGTTNILSIAGFPSSIRGIVWSPLVHWDNRDLTAFQIANNMAGELRSIPAFSATTFVPSFTPGVSGFFPVQFVITGPADFRTLFELATELQDQAKASGKFMFTRLDINFNAANLHLSVNRHKAGAYGVTMADIGNTLNLLLSENYVGHINIDGRSYEVIPQMRKPDRLSPESIGDIHVLSTSGLPVPLKNLVDFEVSGAPPMLKQFNQANAVVLNAQPALGVSIGEAVDFFNMQAGQTLPKGFKTDFMGEARQYVQEGTTLYATFVLALLVIFLVLAAQFESMRDALVVLVSVPLAICGALIVMALGLTTMNIYSQIGLITLVGLITKHGVLICEVARHRQIDLGLNRLEAVAKAARIRLRPILMTTAAMIAGLLPLVFADGAGAESRRSIGLVIVAGLFIGTLFTLLVLPVIYSYIAREHKPLPVVEEH